MSKNPSDNTVITSEKIDGLLAFLPHFEPPTRQYIQEWQGFAPIYMPDVAAFYHLASEPCWLDYDYKPAEAQKMVQNDAFIAQANLMEIKTMLT